MKPVMCFLNSTLAHTDMLDFFLKVSMQTDSSDCYWDTYQIDKTFIETSSKLTKLLLRQVAN